MSSGLHVLRLFNELFGVEQVFGNRTWGLEVLLRNLLMVDFFPLFGFSLSVHRCAKDDWILEMTLDPKECHWIGMFFRGGFFFSSFRALQSLSILSSLFTRRFCSEPFCVKQIRDLKPKPLHMSASSSRRGNLAALRCEVVGFITVLCVPSTNCKHTRYQQRSFKRGEG